MAEELNIRTIIVPPYAGNFSAWGLLGADLLRATARSNILPVSDHNLQLTNDLLDELFNELASRDKNHQSELWLKEVAIDMRYRGQEHSITIHPQVKDGQIISSSQDLQQTFVQVYEDNFGGNLETTTEIVSLRATLRQALPPRKYAVEDDSGEAGNESYTLNTYSFHHNKWQNSTVYSRASLQTGKHYSGPAIITEQTTTTYIDANDTFSIEENGCVMIQHG